MTHSNHFAIDVDVVITAYCLENPVYYQHNRMKTEEEQMVTALSN